jgi:uncharacterized protein (DUF58 family)
MANNTLTERLLPPSYLSKASDTIQLDRRRIYILPTKQGLIFTILLLTMLLGSINYNNSMAFILTFLLCSMFFVAMLHTFRNLAGLKISATRPEPVFAGNFALFPIIINNREGQTRPAINIINQPKSKGFWQFSSLSNRTVFVNIYAGTTERAMLPVLTHVRGILPLERIMIYTYFPLGLFRAWTYINIDQDCIVYPKPAGTLTLPFTHIENSSGSYGTNDGADDFSGFRNYQPGDSIRKIAWKTFAREQGLLIKKFSGNAINEVILQWDDVLNLNTIEERLSQLCRWIVEADKKNVVYSLQLPSHTIETGIGLAHQHHCLESLARFGLKKND